MATSIFFLRHAEVENPENLYYGSTNDIPLSKLGLEQAANLGKILTTKCKHLEAIHVSPLQRTMQTSREIAKFFPETQISPTENLIETISKGLVGMPLSDFFQLGDYYSNKPANVYIEPPHSIVERVIKEVELMLNDYNGKYSAIVSHGDTLAFSLFTLLNPGKSLPPIDHLVKTLYIKKGEGMLLNFNEENIVITSELITQ